MICRVSELQFRPPIVYVGTGVLDRMHIQTPVRYFWFLQRLVGPETAYVCWEFSLMFSLAITLFFRSEAINLAVCSSIFILYYSIQSSE
jgi:hypothetical protein